MLKSLNLVEKNVKISKNIFYSFSDKKKHARHMGHWSLRIKSVRDDDRGLYECQLSIHPTQSIFIELKVVGE